MHEVINIDWQDMTCINNCLSIFRNVIVSLLLLSCVFWNIPQNNSVFIYPVKVFCWIVLYKRSNILIKNYEVKKKSKRMHEWIIPNKSNNMHLKNRLDGFLFYADFCRNCFP